MARVHVPPNFRVSNANICLAFNYVLQEFYKFSKNCQNSDFLKKLIIVFIILLYIDFIIENKIHIEYFIFYMD